MQQDEVHGLCRVALQLTAAPIVVGGYPAAAAKAASFRRWRRRAGTMAWYGRYCTRSCSNHISDHITIKMNHVTDHDHKHDEPRLFVKRRDLLKSQPWPLLSRKRINYVFIKMK